MPTVRRLLAAAAIALGIPAVLLALASLPDAPTRPAGAPRVSGARACQGALGAGAAAVRFELPPGTPIAGFSRFSYVSDGVLEPVGARALVLSAGGCRFAVASAELLTFPEALEAAVRARLADVPLDGLVLGATHTHAGPGGYWDDAIFERAATGPYDPALRDLIANAVAEAIRRAAAAVAPARLSVGRGELPDLVWNRSSEGIDGRLAVLRLDRLGGAPVGELAVFAAHPTTLGMRNRRLSGDWPGRFMEGAAHGVRLFLQGPLGDQSPTLRGSAASPETYGDALSAAVEALPFSRAEAATTLGYARAEVILPPTSVLAAPPLLRRAASNLTRDVLPARATVAALRIGPVLLVAVPGEPVAVVGTRWREVAGAGAEIVGLANGYLGYIETPAHVKAGVGEATRGYYGEELAPRLERAVEAAAEAARAGGASREAASITRPSP